MSTTASIRQQVSDKVALAYLGGIVFHRTDLPRPVTIPAHASNVGDTRLSSADKIAVVDTDKDGRLASAEHATGARTMFATMDVDADGVLTVAEVRAGHDKAMGGEASP